MLGIVSMLEEARSLDLPTFRERHGEWFVVKFPSQIDKAEDAKVGFATRVGSLSQILGEEELGETSQRNVEFLPLQKRPGNPFPYRISVGRARTCDLVLRYPNVSKLHATFLVPREGGVKTPNDVETLSIFDHGSANGTKLDGAVVEKETAKVLCSGSRLDFGGVELRLLDVEAFHALLLERAKAPAAS